MSKGLAICVAAAMFVAATPAAAPADMALGSGEPRALVVDVSGPSAPQIEAFDELADGASIVLDAGTELSLTYYPTCEDLTIRGGHIRIAGEKMTLDKGELVARSQGQCPGNVRLSAVDVVNASVVTRAVRIGPVISTAPKRVGLAGPGAAKYTQIGVYSTDGKVFEAPLEGRGAVWPADAPALTAGGQYTIVFTGPDIQMFAARVTSNAKASPVTVFQIP